MEKKIKIIDLLNKIANGEEVPKKIKYNGKIYEKFDYNNKYYNVENNTREKDILSEYIAGISFYNDEVKIIEEIKLPEKIEYYDDSIAWVIDDVGQLSDVDKVIIDKLNNIIDYLKSKGE